MAVAPGVGVPNHIAIIMDGNGRWATDKGLSRVSGHAEGAEVALRITEDCVDLGIKELSLFALSTENMTRPKEEVDFIVKLLVDVLEREQERLISAGVCVVLLGDCSCFGNRLQSTVERISRAVSGRVALQLNIAFNFSGKWHLEQAFSQSYMGQSLEKALESFRSYLYKDVTCDPDLLIRTGGERRLSNFMLWHCAYSELYFEPCYWPAYTRARLEDALQDFALRKRRFGQLPSTIGEGDEN